jgi:hypothetical protein
MPPDTARAWIEQWRKAHPDLATAWAESDLPLPELPEWVEMHEGELRGTGKTGVKPALKRPPPPHVDNAATRAMINRWQKERPQDCGSYDNDRYRKDKADPRVYRATAKMFRAQSAFIDARAQVIQEMELQGYQVSDEIHDELIFTKVPKR